MTRILVYHPRRSLTMSVAVGCLTMRVSQLIQNETQKLMLVEINEEYVFKILDSPVAPEEKSSPSRALISLLGLFLGFFISCIFFILRFVIQKDDR